VIPSRSGECSQIIALDIGTTITKAWVIDHERHVAAAAQEATPLLRPRRGWVESDMERLWENCCILIQRCLREMDPPGGAIMGIGVTGQGDGLWLINSQGQPLGPAALWCDARSANIVRRWQREGVTEDVEKLSGSTIFPGSPPSLLRWFLENSPALLAKASYLLTAKDWITFKLTGEVTTDYSGLSAYFWQLDQFVPNPSLFSLVGLEDFQSLLPRCIPPARPVGAVTESASGSTGLPSGTLVYSTPYDVPVCVLGAGGLSRGLATVVLGSALCNALFLERGPQNLGETGLTIAFDTNTPSVRLLPAMAGTLNLNWFMQNLCTSTANFDIPAVEREVEKVSSGSNGLLYLPYLSASGERCPFVEDNARAEFFGLSPIHTKWHLARAIYEGVALASRDCLNHYLSQFAEVRLGGGGAKSRIWPQLIADCLNRKVGIIDIEEIGLLGASMTVAVGCGIFADFHAASAAWARPARVILPSAASSLYDQAYRRYRLLRDALLPLWSVQDE